MESMGLFAALGTWRDWAVAAKEEKQSVVTTSYPCARPCYRNSLWLNMYKCWWTNYIFAQFVSLISFSTQNQHKKDFSQWLSMTCTLWVCLNWFCQNDSISFSSLSTEAEGQPNAKATCHRPKMLVRCYSRRESDASNKVHEKPLSRFSLFHQKWSYMLPLSCSRHCEEFCWGTFYTHNLCFKPFHPIMHWLHKGPWRAAAVRRTAKTKKKDAPILKRSECHRRRYHHDQYASAGELHCWKCLRWYWHVS